MGRSWSEAAAAALDAYPWRDPREKARARAEAELVAFGACVEVGDLPLPVRQWLRARSGGPFTGWIWRGESWKDLTEGFERTILAQALAAHGGEGGPGVEDHPARCRLQGAEVWITGF